MTAQATQNKWDQRYLNLAKVVASWSKDPSRQIGSVAIGEKGQVLAQGYNGFPRGISDNPERLQVRAVKYRYVVHAEMNVIYNASYSGVSLANSTLYVHGLPVCAECAKGIIQVGIRRVVIPRQETPENWKDSCAFTKTLFNEAGVQLDEVEFCQTDSGRDESGKNPWEPVRISVTPETESLDGSPKGPDVLVHQQHSTPEAISRKSRSEYFGLDKRLR